MDQSEIIKMVMELFRYFGIGGSIETPVLNAQQASFVEPDDHEDEYEDEDDVPQKSQKKLPGDDDRKRPSTWQGKWDYHYEKPSWERYRSPTEGGLVSRHHPVSQGGFATPTHAAGHEGYDIANIRGTPIYAIGPGVVRKIYQEETNKGGKAISTEHEGGRLTSYYAHLDSVKVREGDRIDQSTMIGTMGDTGNARGSVHLHWHLRLDGQPVNPTQIIGKPIGFTKQADIRKARLNKLARDYRIAALQRLLVKNL